MAGVLRKPVRWALAPVAAVLLWFGGYLWFVAAMPTPDAGALRTDCIAVFTGRYERMAAGLSLLSRGEGRWLLLSGIGEGTDQAELARLRRSAPALYDCCVDLGRAAKDTAANAVETAAWARRRGCGSITLVTDDYHMRRSLLHLRRRLPELPIVPFPVAYETGPQPSRASLRRQVMVEYSKYLVTLAIPWR